VVLITLAAIAAARPGLPAVRAARVTVAWRQTPRGLGLSL